MWLTAEERALYDDLRGNGLDKSLRIEQERIGFGWVESEISAFFQAAIVPNNQSPG